MPVRFSYLYRDASNYKAHGHVVFAGDYSVDELEVLKSRLARELADGDSFVAAQVGVPDVFLWASGGYRPTEDDHGWHEFDGVELVCDAPDDARGRTFEEFVSTFVDLSWNPQEPMVSCSEDDDD